MGLDASYNFTSPGGKREKFSLDILFHRTTYKGFQETAYDCRVSWSRIVQHSDLISHQ